MRSMISGSTAAFLMTVVPSASTDDRSADSVAPTLGYGRSISAPWSRLASARQTPLSSVTDAPSRRRASMWKSIGRAPIASPPTSGTLARPRRWSSGPTMSTGMRLTPENATGTSGDVTVDARMTTRSPWTSTSAPSARHMSRVIATSPMRGTFSRITSSSVSRAATMCFVAAFFAPLARMAPRRGVPPSMR